MALLLTAPLASLASAKAEARAGDTVAIAGDDDCEVETSDTATDDAEANGAEEDILGTEDENGDVQTQDDDVDQTLDGGQTLDDAQLLQVEDGDNGVQQTQYGDDEVEGGDNGVQQVQDGDDDEDDTVVARAGDTVAVASEDCDVESESVNVEDTDDVTIEDDEEVEDSTGQPDGDTIDTSDLSSLPPELEGSSDEDLSDENTSAQDDTAQEALRDILGQLEANEPGEQFTLEESRLGGTAWGSTALQCRLDAPQEERAGEDRQPPTLRS